MLAIFHMASMNMKCEASFLSLVLLTDSGYREVKRYCFLPSKIIHKNTH